MTTIAYRDGILAADSQCQAGSRILGSVRKIELIDTEPVRLVAAAGNLDKCRLFLDWQRNGGLMTDRPDLRALSDNDEDFEAFVVYQTAPDIIHTYETNCIACPVSIKKFYAIGSGAQIAIGALEMGAPAQLAVSIATRYDLYTGGSTELLRFSS